MADLTLQAHVESKLGHASIDGIAVSTADITQYAIDGCKEIVRILKMQNNDDLMNFMNKIGIGETSNPITLSDAEKNDGILIVLRKHGTGDGNYYTAREVGLMSQAKVQDPLSVEYASPLHPAYYYDTRDTINVFPVPSGTNLVDIYCVDSFDDIDAGDTIYSSSFDNFDVSYSNALIYYICANSARALANYYMRLMGDDVLAVSGSVIIPTEPEKVPDLNMNFYEAEAGAVSSITASPLYGYSTESAPIFGLPTISMPSLGSGLFPGEPEIEVPPLTMPAPPSFSDLDLSVLEEGGSDESFTLPTLTLGAPPVYTPPVMNIDYGRLNQYLDDDDIEMASSVRGKLDIQIQEYAQELQNSVNEYSKEVAIYEAETNKRVKEYDSKYGEQLKRWENRVGEYFKEHENEVASEMQQYANAMNKAIKEHDSALAVAIKRFDNLYAQKLKEYETDKAFDLEEWKQNVQHEFNAYQMEYDRDKQKYDAWLSMQVAYTQAKAQTEVAEANAKSQTYSTASSNVTQASIANANNKLQEHASNLNKYSQEWQFLVARSQAKSTSFQALFNSWNTIYKEYDQKFKEFMGLGQAPQQPQQQQGGRNAR